jgi:phage tail-like protein
MAHRNGDPHTRFTFAVDLGDGAGEIAAGGFRKVRGLGSSIETIELRDGGDPGQPARKLPGLRHYSNVTLKRGIITDLRLWQWIDGDPPERRTVTITMLDAKGSPALRFVLHKAWPCRWVGPSLTAKGSRMAIETLELCHERLEVAVI